VASVGLLGDRHELEALFDELAAELHRLETSAEIVMVGGSWMLWHAKRLATRDVDSARRFATDLSQAIARVGARHELSPHWLNDNAAAYWPTGASYDECELVYERGPLRVRTPSADIMFVMKLCRASPQDREDMISLWPFCTFTTAEDAVQAFRGSYPNESDDEYLADYVGEIVTAANRAAHSAEQ